MHDHRGHSRQRGFPHSGLVAEMEEKNHKLKVQFNKQRVGGIIALNSSLLSQRLTAYPMANTDISSAWFFSSVRPRLCMVTSEGWAAWMAHPLALPSGSITGLV